jgi:hypothetical protein
MNEADLKRVLKYRQCCKTASLTKTRAMPKTKTTSKSLEPVSSLIRLCIANHSPEELAIGWLRYEALRRVPPRIFAEISRRNLGREFFDDIVTDALLSWKND